MSESLATILTDTAAAQPDHVAFKLDDLELTYGMLDEGSARIAGLLRSRGIEPGDRVGIMLPNVPYFPVVYYGILRAGGVVVPMNVLLKEREVRFYLEDSGREAAVRLARVRGGRLSPAPRRPARSACWWSRARSSSCWPSRSPTATSPTGPGTTPP